MGLIALALSFSAQFVSAQDSQGMDTALELDIEAQPIGDALNSFAQQSGLQVVFFSEVASGLEVRAAVGDFENSEAALRYLLADTGLDYKFVNERTVAIRAGADTEQQDAAAGKSQPASSPVPMAQNQTPAIQTTSNDKPVEDEGRAARRDGKVEEIMVTGTRIRGLSTTASPQITYDSDDIKKLGVTTVPGLVARLPQNLAAGANEANFNNVRGGAGLNIESGSAINLRGLGTDSTLVLLNGHRLAPGGYGGFVDVSMIPLSAIERVDILTDGASAIYGSDAVAGVINFVLRDDYEGAETRLRGGTVTDGNMDEYQFSQLFGTNWDTGSALLSYEYYNRGNLDANERERSEGRPDPNDILPSQERHSVFLSMDQKVFSNFDLSGTAFYSGRESERITFHPAALETSVGNQESSQLGVNIAADWELIDNWGAEFGASFSESNPKSVFRTLVSNDVSLINNEHRSMSLDAIMDGRFGRFGGGPARTAYGIQYRQEELDRVDESIKYERETFAVFGEIYLPLLGGGDKGPALELSLAGRYEDYSDFGATFDPKIGIRWAPNDTLGFRTTWGTSFRAPLLQELDDTSNQTFLSAAPDPGSPDRSTLALFVFGRNSALDAEESTNLTFGLDVTPGEVPLEFGLTWFSIGFDNRIVTTFAFLDAFTDPVYASIILRNPDSSVIDDLVSSTRFQNLSGILPPFVFRDPSEVEAIVDNRARNAATTDVSGLDFNLAYSLRTEADNSLDLTLSGTYILTFDEQLTPSADVFDVVDTPFNVLDLRLRAGLTWSGGGFSTSAYVNYADEYKDNRAEPEVPVSSWTTLDCRIAYQFGPDSPSWLSDSELSFVLLNAFDRKPPFIRNTDADGLDFDPENASITGRMVSLSVTKRWGQ